MKEPLHVISLGAGVQSSTMALMAACGELTPMPAAAIFADTGAEPESVYRWLNWLEGQLPFPVKRVMQGEGLAKDALRVRQRKDGNGNWVPSGIPHYSLNGDGSRGHGPRQCTADFKIAPIMREARRLMKEAGATKLIQWIGISLDEAHRMKPSRVKYSESIWPLIDLRMRRSDCLRWMEAKGFPAPPPKRVRLLPISLGSRMEAAAGRGTGGVCEGGTIRARLQGREEGYVAKSRRFLSPRFMRAAGPGGFSHRRGPRPAGDVRQRMRRDVRGMTTSFSHFGARASTQRGGAKIGIARPLVGNPNTGSRVNYLWRKNLPGCR